MYYLQGGTYKARAYGYAGIVDLKDISWGFYMNFDNEWSYNKTPDN